MTTVKNFTIWIIAAPGVVGRRELNFIDRPPAAADDQLVFDRTFDWLKINPEPNRRQQIDRFLNGPRTSPVRFSKPPLSNPFSYLRARRVTVL